MFPKMAGTRQECEPGAFAIVASAKHLPFHAAADLHK